MTRPPQHEIDDKGDALFRLRFAEWGVNPSEKDYGWDYVVELFREHKSTGHLLAAQLKSSASTPYSKDQTFISEPLETPAADYLARQLKLPTFLFHADVLTNRLFWTAIQLDAAVLAKLEKGETKSLTVRIPTANVLPDRFDNFLRDIRDVKFALLTKELMGTDNTRFVAAVSDKGPDMVQDVVDDLHEKAFRLELQTAHDIFRIGRLAEAIERLRSLLQNRVASVPIRFNATRNLGQYEWIEISRSDKPQILAAEKLVATAKELCKIAGNGPSSLRLGAIMMRLAAELGVLVHSYFSALMLWRAHSLDGGDPAWLTILTFRLSNALLAVNRKYNRTLRLMKLAERSPYRWITPRPIMDAAKEIAKVAGVMGASGLPEPAQKYRDSAFELFKLAATIAADSHNEQELFEAATLALMIETSALGPIISWSRSTIEKLPANSLWRGPAEESIQRFLQRLQGVTFENDIQTNPRQVHQNILTGFGIDPTEPPWPDLIELAIKDDDPTRVLRDCIHICVSEGPQANSNLRRLALERAGSKILHCSLHGYATGGPDLDGIKLRFDERYCVSCPDRSPRPPNWEASDEWIEQPN